MTGVLTIKSAIKFSALNRLTWRLLSIREVPAGAISAGDERVRV